MGILDWLFGSSSTSPYSKSIEQIKQEQEEARDRFYSNDPYMVTASQAQMLNQQQHIQNQLLAQLADAAREREALLAVKKHEYDELISLSTWCQSVYPEVYGEWRAMQDLKEVSENEGT